MPRKKFSCSHYTSPMKNRVVGLFFAGETISEVARMVGIPWQSCKNIIKHFVVHGTTHALPWSGWPRKLSQQDIQELVEFVKRNRCMPFKEVANEFTPKVSCRTIRRTLQLQGYSRRRPQSVPYLTAKHKNKRLQYANVRHSPI